MTSFVLSPAAQADVDGIWDYTAENWGVDQAESYIADIRDGYRKALVGKHVLFFKTEDTGRITIMRILHQKMDVGRYL